MEKTETLNHQDELVRELRELPHILEVRLPEKEELTYEGRPIREQMEKVLLSAPLSDDTKFWLKNNVAKYIESPTVLDDFTDDGPRDEFEKTLEGKEIYDFYKSNRLRRNNISNVIRFFREIGLFKEEFNFPRHLRKMLDEIYLLVSEKFMTYEKMDIKNKLEMTRRVAELARGICLEIIQIFSQTSL